MADLPHSDCTSGRGVLEEASRQLLFNGQKNVSRKALQVKRHTVRHEFKAVLREEFVDSDRQRSLVEFALRNRRADLLSGRRCSNCWLTKDFCVCGELHKTHNELKHTFLVYMHHKEYMRASNTGKLILSMFPNSKMYLHCVDEDERSLAEALQADPEYTFVLFPSRDAISVKQALLGRSNLSTTSNQTGATAADEWGDAMLPLDSLFGVSEEIVPQDDVLLQHQQHQQQGVGLGTGEAAEATGHRHRAASIDVQHLIEQVKSISLGREVPPCTFVVLDGTWSQAKRLNREIDPSIPRVRIEPATASLFLARQQSQPDRICTVEAVTMLLAELGESDELCDTLLNNLKILVDAWLIQTHQKPHYRVCDKFNGKPSNGTASSQKLA
eukprot:GILJ01004384.1.p1 GENE.GILJ01004384.1~~GILJ01004384.1.p1  ORF type:complete len:385 (-),score=49.36 GILJ01004384.1:129-1283(-)